MCGITALIGEHALYRCVNATLAQIDRGKQGSGFAWQSIESKKLWYIKAPVHPLELAVSQRYFVNNKATIAIGHNRMPSKGEVSKVNTHPFFDCKNRFALVHNGTVHFQDAEIQQLKLKHKLYGETDSEQLTHVICDKLTKNNNDMEKTLEEMISDTTNRNTCILLTKEGHIWAMKDWMPLWICQVKNSYKGDFIAMASEKSAVKLALMDVLMKKTENLEIKWIETDEGDLIHVTPQQKLTIKKHETVTTYNKQLWKNGYYSDFSTVWEYDPIEHKWNKNKDKKITSYYGDL